MIEVVDFAGRRVVCRDLAEQDDLVRRVADNIPNCEVVDRRKVPSYGYRAVHVLVTVEGRTVELQVRTALQHDWAQVSELLADAFGQELKYGLGDSRFLLYLQAMSEAGADVEFGAREGEASERVKSAGQRQVSFEEMQRSVIELLSSRARRGLP